MCYSIEKSISSDINESMGLSVANLYRSYDYNPPVCYRQAMETPYTWIKFNDIYWINRERYESLIAQCLVDPIFTKASDKYYELMCIINNMHKNCIKVIDGYVVRACNKITYNRLYMQAKINNGIKFIGSNSEIEKISNTLCCVPQYDDVNTDVEVLLSDKIPGPLVLTTDTTLEFQDVIKEYRNVWTV